MRTAFVSVTRVSRNLWRILSLPALRRHMFRKTVALVCAALMLAGPSPLVLPDAIGSVIERARLAGDRLSDAWRAGGARTGARSKQDDPTQNRFRVTKVRVTPEKVVIYEGEGMQINCMTMGAFGDPVNGVALGWTSVNERVATVDSTGEVTAVSPGHTVMQVTAGTQRAAIPVEVRAGVRPVLTDTEWWAEQTGGSASAGASDSNGELAFSQNDVNSIPTESFSGQSDIAPSFESRGPNGLLASLLRSITVPAGKIMGSSSLTPVT